MLYKMLSAFFYKIGRSYYDKKQYDKVIEQYASKSKDLSAKSLYYVGLAYYMKEDDNNCIKFMDFSISKDSKDPAPFYIKASTLNYMKKYDEAVKGFQSAITLKADDAEFYSGLGDSYYNLEKLDLGYNKIVDITSLKYMTKLTKLKLNNNNIVNIDVL